MTRRIRGSKEIKTGDVFHQPSEAPSGPCREGFDVDGNFDIPSSIDIRPIVEKGRNAYAQMGL